MRLLLDTHAVLWYMSGDAQLPAGVVRDLQSVQNDLYLSRASLLEVAIKARADRADAPVVFADWLKRIEEFDFQLLEITNKHLLALNTLPQIKDHRDPFDRLLIAQALSEDLTLVSRDSKFAGYAGLQLRWA